MNFPKVFIIILNWNGLHDTLECLESVYKLNYPNFEVILVDNGSTDNSVSVIRENYPQVIMAENKENLGYTGGNNIAMSYAMRNGADYVWLLNNDTTVEYDTLSKIVKTAEKCSEIGLVSPVIYFYKDPERIQFCGDYVDWKGFKILDVKNLDSWFEKKEKYQIVLWGTALLIKSNTIDKIGYLDPKYFAYKEDTEYCVRAVKFGYQCVIEPQAKVFHKDSRSTGGRISPLQIFLGTRNSYFFWMANLKGIKKLNYFRKFMQDVISSSVHLKEKNLGRCFDACLDGAWSAILDVGGPWDRNVRMPYLMKGILSWHSYFWIGLLRGDFLNIASEIHKRIKIRIVKRAA